MSTDVPIGTERARGSPFGAARETLAEKGVSGPEQEAMPAVAAILEGYSYSTDDIDLRQIPEVQRPEGEGNGSVWPWYRIIDSLWKKPPGFRGHTWNLCRSDIRQDRAELVESLRPLFRGGTAR